MVTAIASRNVAFGLVVALAGCQSGIPSGSPDIARDGAPLDSTAHAAGAAHLYVATVANQVLAIERHRLHKGIPAKAPDRVYNVVAA